MLWLKEKREVEIVLGLRTTFTRSLLKSFITCHLINVHLKHCYLFVTTAGIVCMVDVKGKRQTAKKLLPPSAVCRLPSVHLCEHTYIACEQENLGHFCIGGIDGLEAK